MEPRSDEQQAALCLASGKYGQAVEQYQQLIDMEPHVKAHYWHLGLASLLLGDEAEAQTTWMLAMMDGDAEQIEQWTDELAQFLRSQAEQQEASANHPLAWLLRQHLREVAPHDLQNLLHLVQRAIELDRFAEEDLAAWDTIELLRSTAAIDQALLLQTLQAVLQHTPGDPALLAFAEAALDRASDPLPVVHTLMLTSVVIAYELHCPSLAIRYVQLCRKVCPQDLEVLSHLSTFYQNAGQHEQGIETAREWCLLARSLPDQVFGAFLLLRALTRAGGYWKEIFELVSLQESLLLSLAASQTEPLNQNTTLRLVTTTFFLPYVRDNLEHNRLAQNHLFQLCQSSVRAYAAEAAERYQEGLALRRDRQESHERLRIGYFSHCLRRHSVGWLSRWLIQHHDRKQFELYGYFWNYNDGNDSLQDWFVEQVDHARKLGRDGLAIAEQIYQDDIDILIDLDSITADVCSEVMALKPAPVQATWLGWDASGMPAIDYFIADPYVLSDAADAHYAEKIWRLPQTYIAVDGFEVGIPTLRRDDLGIPDDAIIYLSGQSASKRHPETVRSQLRIIAAVPNSYLLVKGITDDRAIQTYFAQVAAAEGVTSDRLRFLPEVSTEAVHRANLSIADVVLDTYPYNGATTTMETLWMGIPLVTRVGEQFASRNSYTMMVNAGIKEGIAWTNEEYVEWGIRLGKEVELRQHVAWKLQRSRQTAPLWNAKQFTREMERAYKQMWQAYITQ
ncbi:MAG: O-linked N-acetylglucosamine transferase, SPINDLY family protein [Tildeniella nuda ZEHNDER 1965/U140]|nr:O-linked N-acetylglucosamine transferase, SPINDLY family protein [Tildeniella nuda ZEHNDER 1965/U140]